jgi:hypothetical protein
MTLRRSKNQSILLRIASSTPQKFRSAITEEFVPKHARSSGIAGVTGDYEDAGAQILSARISSRNIAVSWTFCIPAVCKELHEITVDNANMYLCCYNT